MIAAVMLRIATMLSIFMFGACMYIGSKIGGSIYDAGHKLVSNRAMARRERKAEKEYVKSQIVTEISETMDKQEARTNTAPRTVKMQPGTNFA